MPSVLVTALDDISGWFCHTSSVQSVHIVNDASSLFVWSHQWIVVKQQDMQFGSRVGKVILSSKGVTVPKSGVLCRRFQFFSPGDRAKNTEDIRA